MDFEDVIVKESPGVCRCCLSEGCYKDLGSEYLWMEETEVYADMLLECFDISISQHSDGPNGMSRLICEVCVTRLRDACNFKKQVLQSEKRFIDMVARGDFENKDTACEDNIKLDHNEEPMDSADVDYFDEGIDFDGGNNESEEIAVEPIKIRSKPGRPKRNAKVDKKSNEATPSASKTVAKDTTAEGPYENFASVRRRKNMEILFNNTSIIPFKWRSRYMCFYCSKEYSLYPDFRKHTKGHGLCTKSDHSLKIIKGSNIEIKLDISEINCELCDEPFPKFENIIDHLIQKHALNYDKSIDIPFQQYKLADMKCQYCSQDFTYFGYLITHLNLAHPQDNFICDDCGATFNKKKSLVNHFRCFHREGGYPCDSCQIICDSQLSLRKHKNGHHFRKCCFCGLSYASNSLLKRHLRSEHCKFADRICPYCSKRCLSAQGVKQHIIKCKRRKQLPIEIDSTFDNNIEPKKKQNLSSIRQNIINVLNMSTAVPFKFFGKFTCFYCPLKFLEFDDLKAHTAQEHPSCDLNSQAIKKCKGERTVIKLDIANLSCKVCNQSVSELDELIEHIITRHNATYDKTLKCFDPFTIRKDNISCTSCAKEFRYFAPLLRHVNSEHGKNNRICDICGRSFKSVAHLKIHFSYEHTGSFTCDDCGVNYKNQWCLGRHKAKCHNVKQFKCSKCSEMFQSPYQMQKHLIEVHNIGHKCSDCGRMFTRNSFMKDHIRRTHLKEKNVPCSICNEKFFDNHLLKMHMVKHEGERKFSCDVCGKTFLRRSNLASHMAMHKKYGHVPATYVK
ncbi:zinc finger protein 62-like isoform X1 [Leptidea sinapis]|uniref:zinc finger protein 62-like isoform X1 n=1 Tax=Leptidea sinapis TaxID=189913 RepID=UPI0021C4519D|nr:zinc finger protein 62-like isoform X1 [Leptidea sinapis]